MELFRHAAQTEMFPSGARILQRGTPGHRMYVIQEGEVEIRIGPRTFERVGAGGFFGEMSLIDDAPRSADVVAATDVVLVPIDEKRFERMVHDTPGFALAVMRELVRRLRVMDGRA
jgi:CRP-like cAMP-binding protein